MALGSAYFFQARPVIEEIIFFDTLCMALFCLGRRLGTTIEPTAYRGTDIWGASC